MTFDWSDLVAIAALLLSLVALYQTSIYRRRDLWISVMKEGSELVELMLELRTAPDRLHEEWQAALSTAKWQDSHLATSKEAAIERIRADTDTLKRDFDKFQNTRPNAEEDLKDIYFLRARCDALLKRIALENAELKGFIEERGQR